MVTLQNIQQSLNIGKIYYQVLLEKYKANLVKGCEDMPEQLNCLKWLITAINPDLRDVVNTDKTQALYAKLVTILGAFNSAFTVDTDVVIPNTTYEIISNTGKPPIYITDADFVGNTYTNTSLVGNNSFAVFDQNLNRYLVNGTEFTYNASGGIIIVNGIYGGESFVLIF